VPARFDLAALLPVWRFSLGMTLVTLTAVVLMQFDKVVLSKLLSMEMFGYYMVAVSVANFIPQLVAPIYTAVFPRLSRLVATDDHRGQAQLFHQGAQLIALVVHPIAVAVALFSTDILAVWTGNPAVAARAGGVLTLLAAGALLNSVMVIPYVAQLAFGATRIAVTVNVVMAAVMVPYAIVATRAHGLEGAASTWVVVNAVYVLVGATLTFRRLLHTEARAWWFHDVAVPVAAVAAVQALVWWVGAPFHSAVAVVAKVGFAIALSALAVLAVARELRTSIVTRAVAWRTSAG
jgi:O-antigen/teichoic acid export membrane protein